MRKLGQMGEDIFKLLCSSVGLTCNESQQDETGWDFIVEFPIDRAVPLPIDMQPPSMTCFVQVKSTDLNTKGVRLALSNLKRLVDHSLPAFICVFVFEGHDKPSSAYILHIDEKLIEKILKTIRKLQAKGKTNLHRHTLLLPLQDKDRINTIDGPTLSKELRTRIGRPFESYAQWKRQLVKRIGFGKRFGKGSFSVKSSDPASDLVDLTLGLEPEVEIVDFRFSSVRFGIEVEHPRLSGETTRIAITPSPVTDCEVVFRITGEIALTFPGKIYVPAVPDLPQKLWKIRVSAGIVEMTISPNEESENFTIIYNADEKRPLAQLSELITLLGTMHNEGIEVEVSKFKSVLFSGAISRRHDKFNAFWRAARECIMTLVDLDKTHKLDMSLSLNDVAPSINDLIQFTAIYRKKIDSMTFAATADVPSGLDGHEVAAVLPIHLGIGEYDLILYSLHIGQMEITDTKSIKLRYDKKEIIEVALFKNDSETLNKVADRARKLAEVQTRKFQVCIAVDLKEKPTAGEEAPIKETRPKGKA